MPLLNTGNLNLTLEGLILLITFLINLSIAIFVFVKNPRKRSNIVFGLLMFFVACWNIAIFLSNFLNTYDQAMFWTQWALGAVLFIPSLILYFSYIFPRRKELKKWQLFIIFIPSFAALPFIRVKFHDIINSKKGFFLKKTYGRIKEKIKVEKTLSILKKPTICNIIITQKPIFSNERLSKRQSIDSQPGI